MFVIDKFHAMVARLFASIATVRATRGAKLLDIHAPHWPELVSIKSLDMSDGRLCLLGQVYGRYWNGREKLRIDDWGTAVHYGFHTSMLGYLAGRGRGYYRALDKAWADLLIARHVTAITEATATAGQVSK